MVFEGEFYGPPLPDPNLPESIKKSYHGAWGHLGCCRTKLIVHAIHEVKAAPAEGAVTHEAGHAEGITETVDPNTGNLHLTIPIVATNKPRQ